jgi:tryptophanyl-tRNA synthetase
LKPTARHWKILKSDTCNAFAIYSLLATEEQIAAMKALYLGGNYGYGHAKQALYELICETFKTERENTVLHEQPS